MNTTYNSSGLTGTATQPAVNNMYPQGQQIYPPQAGQGPIINGSVQPVYPQPIQPIQPIQPVQPVQPIYVQQPVYGQPIYVQQPYYVPGPYYAGYPYYGGPFRRFAYEMNKGLKDLF